LDSKDSQIYDLYGVSNHFGGLGGGHYTAHVFSEFLDSWIEMNDERVRKVSPEKAVSSSAYILFYKRRN
jgi:ubiquitin C-terminal hydrolase